jgi:hypothetical protein
MSAFKPLLTYVPSLMNDRSLIRLGSKRQMQSLSEKAVTIPCTKPPYGTEK